MKCTNIFFFGITLCQLRKQLRPLTGKNILSFSLFILILCITFHEMHKHFMSRSTLCQLMEQLRPLTGNPLELFCFLLFILILCIPVH